MEITAIGWTNKKGTGERYCNCKTWKQHWLNFSKQQWPISCSVKGCYNSPTLGGHVINSAVTGEHIIPMCSSCNGLDKNFNLNGGVTVVPANKAETCEK